MFGCFFSKIEYNYHSKYQYKIIYTLIIKIDYNTYSHNATIGSNASVKKVCDPPSTQSFNNGSSQVIFKLIALSDTYRIEIYITVIIK